MRGGGGGGVFVKYNKILISCFVRLNRCRDMRAEVERGRCVSFWSCWREISGDCMALFECKEVLLTLWYPWIKHIVPQDSNNEEKIVRPQSIYIKCLGVMLTPVNWFRATGRYICVCGRPSNLVKYDYNLWCHIKPIRAILVWNIVTYK